MYSKSLRIVILFLYMEASDLLRECNTCYSFYIYIFFFILHLFVFINELIFFLRDCVTFLLINSCKLSYFKRYVFCIRKEVNCDDKKSLLNKKKENIQVILTNIYIWNRIYL